MSNSIFFQVSSLFYIIMLIVIYFSKKRLLSFENKIFSLFKILFLFFGLLIFILPLNYYNKDGKIYSYGISATLSYIIGGIYIAICLIITIKNFKKIQKIKCVPLILYLIMFPLILSIQAVYP